MAQKRPKRVKKGPFSGFSATIIDWSIFDYSRYDFSIKKREKTEKTAKKRPFLQGRGSKFRLFSKKSSSICVKKKHEKTQKEALFPAAILISL